MRRLAAEPAEEPNTTVSRRDGAELIDTGGDMLSTQPALVCLPSLGKAKVISPLAARSEGEARA
eukprot:4787230-Amphidinium_carterae.1